MKNYLNFLHWELGVYGLEGRPVHFDFYTSVIDLRSLPNFPSINDDTTKFILAWCDQH